MLFILYWDLPAVDPLSEMSCFSSFSFRLPSLQCPVYCIKKYFVIGWVCNTLNLGATTFGCKVIVQTDCSHSQTRFAKYFHVIHKCRQSLTQSMATSTTYLFARHLSLQWWTRLSCLQTGCIPVIFLYKNSYAILQLKRCLVATTSLFVREFLFQIYEVMTGVCIQVLNLNFHIHLLPLIVVLLQTDVCDKLVCNCKLNPT